MRAVVVASVALIACGSSYNTGDDDILPIDASTTVVPIDGPPDAAVPVGLHFHYVVDRLLVPSAAGQAQLYAQDLNGDGIVDNALGNFLATFPAQFAIDPQVVSDQAIYGGAVTLLTDIQTADFMSSPAAAFELLGGTGAMPPACGSGEVVTCGSDGTCTGCQGDFTGSASFDVDPNPPTNPPLLGAITSGVYSAGPGALALDLPFPGMPVELDLVDARVLVNGITPTTIGSASDPSTGIYIGGGVSMTDVDQKICAAIAAAANTALSASCSAGSGSAGCSCSTAAATTFETLYDANGDCTVTLAEVQTSHTTQTQLAPDLVIGGVPLLSLGVKAYAVSATYTVAGE